MTLTQPTRKGLLTAAVMIAASLLAHFVLHWREDGPVQYLLTTLLFSGLVWTLWAQHRARPDAAFAERFSEGFRCFIVVAFLMTAYAFAFYQSQPEILEQKIVHNNELLRAEGQRTPAEIAENEKKIRSLFMPMMLSLTSFRYLISGALATVALALYFSRKRSSR